MTHSAGMAPRLAREAAHFQKHYEDEAAHGIEPLSEFDKRRYAAPPANTVFPREYFYHLLSPLEGKDTLEIACGNGIDACLCAHYGANVRAYDLSSNAVELTRRRARVNGLAERVQARVAEDLGWAFAGERFDAILGYAALHHLPLQGLAERVYERLRPGGVAVFAEPVVNSRALQALRRCIPYSFAEPTEDEQPLNDEQIARFERVFDRSVKRHFQCVSRVWPLFRGCWPVVAGLHRVDGHLMRLPWLRRFATVVVFGLYRDR